MARPTGSSRTLQDRRDLFERRREWLAERPDYERRTGVLSDEAPKRRTRPTGRDTAPRFQTNDPTIPGRGGQSSRGAESSSEKLPALPEIPSAPATPGESDGPALASLLGGRTSLLVGAGVLLGGALLYRQMRG
jgi:hypothetical protein